MEIEEPGKAEKEGCDWHSNAPKQKSPISSAEAGLVFVSRPVAECWGSVRLASIGQQP